MTKLRANRFLGFFLSSLMGAFAVTFVAYATSVGTNVSVSGTLDASGLTTFSGSMQASSTALFGGAATFYGNLTLDKAATTTVTFNQAGINFDSNTFVIDPNANMIGIGTSSPTVMFSVHGSSLLGSADANTLTVRAGTWTLASTATTTVAMPNGINFDSNTFVIDPNANRVGVGTSSPAKTFGVTGDEFLESSATTTMYIHTTSATKAGCIEFTAAGGAKFRAYATTTGPLQLTSGTCQ